MTESRTLTNPILPGSIPTPRSFAWARTITSPPPPSSGFPACSYNSSKFHYLYVSHDDTHGKHLRVMSRRPDQIGLDAFSAPIPIPSNQPVELRVEVDYERLYFGYRVGRGPSMWLAEPFDASLLSDEAILPGLPNFTGAFVAWPARTWRARGGLPTSTTLTTRRARSCRTPASESPRRASPHVTGRLAERGPEGLSPSRNGVQADLDS